MTDRKFTPHLREGLGARPEEFARSTCFEGGYLTSVNAGWRSLRPLIDPVQCTLCLNCYMYCPDGTIFKVRDGEGVCSVCAKVCPVPCIAMVDERGDGEVAAGISGVSTERVLQRREQDLMSCSPKRGLSERIEMSETPARKDAEGGAA